LQKHIAILLATARQAAKKWKCYMVAKRTVYFL